MFNAKFSTSNTMDAKFSSSEPMKATFAERIGMTIGAQTIHPSLSDQTIPYGRYLTGDQKIKGVLLTNLTADKILSGTTVKIGDSTDDDCVASVAGSYVYNPFGDSAELIATYPKETFLLKNTSFNGWTPSTTAKTIKSSANYGTVSADMEQYEYFTKIMVDAKIVYADGTTLSGAMVRQINELFQYMYRKPNSLTNIASATDNYNYCTTMYTTPFMEYWNTGSPPVHTMTYTGSYGFYPTAASHTFSSSTSLTPTITIKRPLLNARCHNTYMTTAMAGAVDQNNSKIEVWGFLYRCKKGSFGWAVWRDLIAAYNA